MEFRQWLESKSAYEMDVETARSLLGVGPQASEHDIKVAFMRKSYASHPDQGGDAQTFGRLKTAYDLLLKGPEPEDTPEPEPPPKPTPKPPQQNQNIYRSPANQRYDAYKPTYDHGDPSALWSQARGIPKYIKLKGKNLVAVNIPFAVAKFARKTPQGIVFPDQLKQTMFYYLHGYPNDPVVMNNENFYVVHPLWAGGNRSGEIAKELAAELVEEKPWYKKLF